MLRISTFLAFIFLLSGCVLPPPTPPLTALEIRAIQTRSYDNIAGRSKRIMKAVIDVLQDEGYIVSNADKELGFITARKEEDLSNNWGASFSLLGNRDFRYRKNSLTEASVNVTERGSNVKVRAVFQTKVLDNLGGTMSVHQITQPDFYQDFFQKVDKGVFLERQNL